MARSSEGINDITPVEHDIFALFDATCRNLLSAEEISGNTNSNAWEPLGGIMVVLCGFTITSGSMLLG